MRVSLSPSAAISHPALPLTPDADSGRKLPVHEEACNKPTGGGCEFHLRADGRVISVVAIDPFNLLEDRIWHEIRLALPHNRKGRHDIALETRPIGNSTAFRWGAWRAPSFLHSLETETVTTS
jgi:hypothetical protein